jgi:steroid 5-alpha reductase family enzyme
VFRDYATHKEQTYPRLNAIIGVTISLFGIVFEAIADYQLHIYKKNISKAKPEVTCSTIEISKDPLLVYTPTESGV